MVPEFMKDDSYWSKRRKNNEAARHSREAKRRKENQIVMRAAFLESENSVLRDQIGEQLVSNDVIRNDVKSLAKKIRQYESCQFENINYQNQHQSPPQMY